MLISVRAMTAEMQLLKPFFKPGEIKRKGVFVIATVMGDLHDIGKNIVHMTVEGSGWEVIYLGFDVKPEKFIEAIDKNPDCFVGLSALLTTTMAYMEIIVKEILAGCAPLSQDFCNKIGASFYSPDPKDAVEFLKKVAA